MSRKTKRLCGPRERDPREREPLGGQVLQDEVWRLTDLKRIVTRSPSGWSGRLELMREEWTVGGR